MPNRAQRRAAMRQAKLVEVAATQLPTTHSPLSTSEPRLSEAKLAANRANAQLSTGPTSEAGKSVSRMNAVKTGLTGQLVLLPSDSADAYQAHVARQMEHFKPATAYERELVQKIADTDWRLLRIPMLESAIYGNGRRELADEVAEIKDPAEREVMLTGMIFEAYRRDLTNIALQERRLRNHREKDIKELKAIQQERIDAAKAADGKLAASFNHAVAIHLRMEEKGKTFDPAEFGFEFSHEEMHTFLEANLEQYQTTQQNWKFEEWFRNRRKAQNEVAIAA